MINDIYKIIISYLSYHIGIDYFQYTDIDIQDDSIYISFKITQKNVIIECCIECKIDEDITLCAYISYIEHEGITFDDIFNNPVYETVTNIENINDSVINICDDLMAEVLWIKCKLNNTIDNYYAIKRKSDNDEIAILSKLFEGQK